MPDSKLVDCQAENISDVDALVIRKKMSSQSKELDVEPLLKVASSLVYFLLAHVGFTMSYYFVSRLRNPVLIDSVGLGFTWLEATTLAPLSDVIPTTLTFIHYSYPSRLSTLVH